jgi:predicted metal-dependent hydrolase
MANNTRIYPSGGVLEKEYGNAVQIVESSTGRRVQNVKLVTIDRAKTRYGRCTRKLNTMFPSDPPLSTDYEYTISISKHLLFSGDKREILNTLVHELLHTWCHGHGKDFKRAASQIYDLWKIRIDRLAPKPLSEITGERGQ